MKKTHMEKDIWKRATDFWWHLISLITSGNDVKSDVYMQKETYEKET